VIGLPFQVSIDSTAQKAAKAANIRVAATIPRMGKRKSILLEFYQAAHEKARRLLGGAQPRPPSGRAARYRRSIRCGRGYAARQRIAVYAAAQLLLALEIEQRVPTIRVDGH